jgi:hypothetical protein
VFALRNIDGEVEDIYEGENSPYSARPIGIISKVPK